MTDGCSTCSRALLYASFMPGDLIGKNTWDMSWIWRVLGLDTHESQKSKSGTAVIREYTQMRDTISTDLRIAHICVGYQ